jgi:hypothetical protein
LTDLAKQQIGAEHCWVWNRRCPIWWWRLWNLPSPLFYLPRILGKRPTEEGVVTTLGGQETFDPVPDVGGIAAGMVEEPLPLIGG